MSGEKSKDLHGHWLPLLNYSSKYGISLSTLRRRIKSNTIQFKLESGKYFIQEDTPKGAESKSTPSPSAATASSESVLATASAPAPALASRNAASENHDAPKSAFSLNASSFVEASVLSSANRLVEEIKAAYAKILQEKEEQIAQFREEVSDLRMLVRILEEGAQLRMQAGMRRQPEVASAEMPQENLSVSAENPYSPETLNETLNQNNDIFFGDFQNREI